MRYFKIRIGFGKDDDRYVSIDENELEAALYCFMTNSKGIFKNGVFRGIDIISITEDWHKEMGWNPEYRLEIDDWNEIKDKGIEKKYSGIIGAVKEKIQYLIETNQQNLIGKNIDIELPKKSTGISESTKTLADGMSIRAL